MGLRDGLGFGFGMRGMVGRRIGWRSFGGIGSGWGIWGFSCVEELNGLCDMRKWVGVEVLVVW